MTLAPREICEAARASHGMAHAQLDVTPRILKSLQCDIFAPNFLPITHHLPSSQFSVAFTVRGFVPTTIQYLLLPSRRSKSNTMMFKSAVFAAVVASASASFDNIKSFTPLTSVTDHVSLSHAITLLSNV